MYELFQSLASDSNSTNLTLGQDLIKQGQNKINSRLKVHTREKTKDYTLQTDAISGTSNQAYYLPHDFLKVIDLYETVSSDTYHANPVYDEKVWRRMNSGNTSTSDYLQYYFIRGNRLEIFPLPSTTRTMTLVYKPSNKLFFDDYNTGTITTLTNGSASVTGDSTVWIDLYIGRMFKIDDDGEWYEIVARDSATEITLVEEYQGTSIAAGSDTYTIGQMPPTPATTHILPVYYALWHYFMMKKETYQSAREYKDMFREGLEEAQEDFGSFDDEQIIEADLSIHRQRFVNPNLFPTNLS